MIVRAIDSYGDWVFGTGIQSYKKNQDAVGQLIKTDCSSFLGDCFFAVTSGIDWYNLLTVNNLLAIKLAIAATILNVGGGGIVTGILELSTDTSHETRLFLVQYKIVTIYSQTPLSGEFQYSGSTSG